MDEQFPQRPETRWFRSYTSVPRYLRCDGRGATVTYSLSNAEARLLRLRAQRLDPNTSADTVSDVVRSVCGVQAQDRGAGTLSIRPRSRNTTAEDVERALVEDRSIVRTWCMRGTLHFVAAADLPWLLALFGPHYTARGPERRRLAELGLDDEACDRAMAVIRDALVERSLLTREEIVQRLQQAGIDVDPDTQAPYHLVRRAALCGILCEGASSGGTMTYDLLDRWVPESVELDQLPDRMEALVILARRYLAAFGPATIEDFATWCRLFKRDVREAWDLIASERIEVTVDGEQRAMLADRTGDIEAVRENGSNGDRNPDPDPLVRLLPYYDTSLLGYETGNRGVPPEYAKRVWPGAALIRPVVTVEGEAVATWKLDRSRTVARIQIEPFDVLGSVVEAGIDTEADDIGRFLDSEIEVEYRFVA